jgi:hypothetical protein
LGCWISPRYSLFSLGTRFETYEMLISLKFLHFSGRSKLQITETMDTETVDTGARPYSDK